MIFQARLDSLGGIRLKLSLSQVVQWLRDSRTMWPAVVDMTCGVCNRLVTIRFTIVYADSQAAMLRGTCPACRDTNQLWIPQCSRERHPTEVYVWPQPKAMVEPLDGIDNVPDSVRRAYEEALGCFRAGRYIATVAMCRRSLEALVKDVLGRSDGSLFKDLQRLSEEVDLGANIKELADVLREVGNMGAHFDDRAKFDVETARTMLAFLEYLLEFMYILPQRSRNLAERIRSLGETSPLDRLNN